MIICCINKRKEHLKDLEKKIQLNMDIETSKDVELTGNGLRKKY